jgi:choline/glycine/proline betaine transport protein
MVGDSSAPSNSNKSLGLDINPPVFWTSIILVVVFVVLTLVNVKTASAVFSAAKFWVCEYTGWFFVFTVNVILAYSIWLIFSKYADLRIGGQDSRPEFSLFAWFSMLFSAGMGIGLLFYGVAEPIYHYMTPPMGVEPKTLAAAQLSMGITFFHWGLHAWGVYAVLGLGLAFFAFTRGLPLTMSTVFYPLIGEKVYGPIGHAVDILASIATLFGLATSLGLGVTQINAGLNYVFGVPISTTVQITLIVIITGGATMSVVAGLEAGIKRLSIINIVLGISLMVFVFFMGPTLFILDGIPQNIGNYLQNFVKLSFWTEAYTQTKWQNGWTIFYWAWWIAWAPFVGMFIARISKGRTVKEFLLGVLFVPTLLTFVWLTVFGGSALYVEMFGAGGISEAVNNNVATAMYTLFENFPLAKITSVIGIFVVAFFFITSSDSASLVIDIITAGGKTEPPTIQRVFWASTEGICAAILLLGGGLGALQTACIVTGLPFAAVLLVMLISLKKGLDEEYARVYGQS